MTARDRFRDSLAGAAPPADAGLVAQALWWAGKGDWDAAHRCVQRNEGAPECDLVHAHLHRQEGDVANASYWYRRAGRSVPNVSLDDEWGALVTEFVQRRP